MNFLTRIGSALGLGLALLTTPTLAQELPKKTLRLAETQATLLLQQTAQATQVPVPAGKPPLVSPRTVDAAGHLVAVPTRDWTSGFFPGYLWLLYQATGQARWRTAAEQATARLAGEETNGSSHDVGFKLYCSYGTGYRVAPNPAYREVLLTAARTLSTRFNPTVGAIRSWDHHQEQWQFPVIIDNMLNLELLFAATRLSGDSSFYKIAVAHANTTLKNHFRPDYSSYHVVGYDPKTGQVEKKTTHQGYADNSAWARGQAWALYGFTMCYRETHDPRYLAQAEHVADFILHHPNLPKDLVPYWDFNDPAIPHAPRDASAGAVMASGLLELSTYSTQGTTYRRHASQLLDNLAKSYTAAPGTACGFLLLHSTGHKPANSEIDVPLSYADYYFMEALLRRQCLAAGRPLSVR
ncbi:MAG: glycoside hydrolase family 88 protein [Janthinobacterium lividum]